MIMSFASLALIVLVSLTIAFAVEKAAPQQSLDRLCGSDISAHPAAIPDFDACTRRIFLDSGCTPSGTLWPDVVSNEFALSSPISLIRFHAQTIYAKAVAESISSNQTSGTFRTLCGI